MTELVKCKLDIAQVTPGMKLAEPITNASGITLMPAGIRLTPMFIIRLKKWNIDTVAVFAEPPKEKKGDTIARQTKTLAAGGNLTAEQGEFAREVASDVSKWFVNVRDNPLMMQLRNVVVKRLIIHDKNGMINVMRRPPGAVTAGGTQGAARNGA